MKKPVLLPILLSAILCLVGSCDKSEEKTEDADYENVQIRSVVWNAEEDKYTFWLSPTEGLTDRDGMLLSDDYICVELTSEDRPSSNYEFTSKTTSLSYGSISVNSSTIDNFTQAELYVNLESDNVVEFKTVITPKEGKALKADYRGFCSKWPEEKEAKGETYSLDRVPFFYYAGPTADSSVHEFYLVLANASYTGDSAAQASLTEEGYLVCIDFYAEVDTQNKKHLPDGVYTRSTTLSDHTWKTSNTLIEYYDKKLSRSVYQVADDKIELVEKDGVYSLKVPFQNSDYRIDTLSYTGVLPSPQDLTRPSYALPQVEGDITFTGAKATGIYMGNLLQGAAGMMQISIYDQDYVDEKIGGQGVLLVVFADLFTNSRSIRVMPGEYTMKTDFTYMSWMPTREVNYSGSVFPLGTYGVYNDGSRNGQFSYAVSGSVTITEVSEGLHVEWDLVSGYGYSIKGEYTGTIPVEDQSDDDTHDDGTSTLEKDYVLDLSGVKSASLHSDDQIFVIGYGTFKPVSDYGCGHQFIDIGGFSGNGPEGDSVRLELLTQPGQENQVNVGKYEITPERHPAYFIPGWAVKGSFYEGGELDGTTFKHYYGRQGESGRWYYYMDAHAAFYNGTVTISEAENGEYLINIETYDVRGHKITGVWTGPVEIN